MRFDISILSEQELKNEYLIVLEYASQIMGIPIKELIYNTENKIEYGVFLNDQKLNESLGEDHDFYEKIFLIYRKIFEVFSDEIIVIGCHDDNGSIVEGYLENHKLFKEWYGVFATVEKQNNLMDAYEYKVDNFYIYMNIGKLSYISENEIESFYKKSILGILPIKV